MLKINLTNEIYTRKKIFEEVPQGKDDTIHSKSEWMIATKLDGTSVRLKSSRKPIKPISSLEHALQVYREEKFTIYGYTIRSLTTILKPRE